MQRMIARACLLCALLAPAASQAWDVEPGITGAALTGYLPKGVTLQRVDVTLTDKSATLTYHGSSKATESHPVVLTSYSHAFSWQGIGADYPDQHMPELTLRVNGKAIKDQPYAQALFNGADVTRDLKRAKLDPLLVAKGEDALVESPGRLAKPFLSNDEAPFFPLWQLSYRHTWRIPGIPAGDLSMQVAYRLRPAKTEIATASKQFEGAVLSHCGDIQAIKHILESRQGSVPDSVVIETFTIPLQIANMASMDTYLTVHDVPSSTRLPVAAILACGPEDKALMGTPSIKARTADGPSLSILQILIQS